MTNRGWLSWPTFIICLGWGLPFVDTLQAGPLSTERVPWQKVPIELSLRVGQERLVHFPASVRVGIPAHLQPVLRAQSVAGTLYLLANQPFGPTRVVVREIEEGHIYLLDLEAREGASKRGPVRIFVPEAETTAGGSVETQEAQASSGFGYVMLIRFGAKQLYAPLRLIESLPGVVRVPIGRERAPLVRGGAVEAKPLVAWRSGDLYLTAVKLTNISSAPVTLDPRNLRGAWLAATFQHNRLLSAGDEGDTTALYLISSRPFADSL